MPHRAAVDDSAGSAWDASGGRRLHRFFVHGPLQGATIFPPQLEHQLRHVLRLRQGDLVIILLDDGQEHLTELRENGGRLEGTVLESRPNAVEPAIEVVIGQCLVKNPKFELVLQKCTELGAARFVPMRSERSVREKITASRHTRYEGIVREAAEQSGRGRLPRVEAVTEVATAVPVLLPAIILDPGAATPFGRVVKEHHRAGGRRLSILIGPEGGFTSAEIAAAKENGAVSAGLGRRILRAETAAVAACAIAFDLLEDGSRIA
ncbi:MAG TPA: RsmE family RNA methyltransferase [Chloroflexota bacterium]|nr:RsmE family RNA methyltransferase [Chloroflexota bacterium]